VVVLGGPSDTFFCTFPSNNPFLPSNDPSPVRPRLRLVRHELAGQQRAAQTRRGRQPLAASRLAVLRERSAP
jgi:hypothetical protein